MDGSNHIRYSKPMPDMKFIDGQIPIQEVARALGFEMRGRKATCPECGKRRLTFSVKFNCWRCCIVIRAAARSPAATATSPSLLRLTDRSRCHCVLAGSAAASRTRMSREAW